MEQAFKHTDVFLTHTWRNDLHGRNNHQRVSIVGEQLSRLGFSCWLDEKRMTGNIQAKMAEGVDFTRCVLIFVTDEYMKKITSKQEDNCKFEFERALSQKTEKNILCIVMEKKYEDPNKWFGKLKEHLSGCLYVSMAEDFTDKQYLNNQLQSVVKQLQEKGVNPSLMKNKCNDCEVVTKNGKKHAFYYDGKFCTVCASILIQTGDPKNYCKDCNRHENFDFCGNCKAHLLDKSKQINELMDQFIKLMTLDSTTDVSKVSVKEFEEKINVMKQKLHELQLKREEVTTSGETLEINDNDHKSKIEEFQSKMENTLKISTDVANSAEDILQNLEPKYKEKLQNLNDAIHHLQSDKIELDQRADKIQQATEKLQQLSKEISAYSDDAVMLINHQHGNDCSCERCTFDRYLTSQLITNGPQYLQSLISENDITKVKLAIELKKPIMDMKDINHLNLLMSLTLQHGSKEMFIMLLESGLNVHIDEMRALMKTDYGKNFLKKIISENSKDDLWKIITLREDIMNISDNDPGFNLLMWLTLQHGSKEMLIMLLESGLHAHIDEMRVLMKTDSGKNFLKKIICENCSDDLWKIVTLREDIMDVKDESGFSLILFLTVQHGTLDMFTMLLEKGLDVRKMNEHRETILHYIKQVDIMRWMCWEHGRLLLPIKNTKGCTAFMKYFIENNLHILEVMVPFVRQPEIEMKESEIIEPLMSKGFTYIEQLVKDNEIVAMKKLLLLRNDVVHLVGKYKTTPLLWCSDDGSLRMLKLLLEHGSDVNHHDTDGDTCLHLAVRNEGHSDAITNHLCTTFPHLIHTVNESKKTPLLRCCEYGSFNSVKLLLEHGSDVNHHDEYDNTCLHLAVENKEHSQSITNHLCTTFPHLIHLVNKEKRTPLLHCCVYGSFNSVKLLLEHGSDVNHHDKDGDTCLHLAVNNKEHSQAITNHLCTTFPHIIHSVNEKKRTPLLDCCFNDGSFNSMKLLLDHGSDVNYHDDDGRTVLHHAMYNDNEGESIVEYLCEKYPHLMTEGDDDGWSVFHYAVSNNKVNMVRIILQRKPPTTILLKKDKWGESPVDFAKEKKNETIVQMFEEYLKEHSDITTTTSQ